MMERRAAPEHPPPFHVEVTFFSLLGPEERLAILRGHREEVAACLANVEAQVPAVERNLDPGRLRYVRRVLERRAALLRQELAWTDELIAEEERDGGGS